MTTARTSGARQWQLGAILAERSVDPLTYVLVARADAGAGAARGLARRLLGLRLAGYTTLIVDLVGGEHASGAMLAALLLAQRKLRLRDARLVLTAPEPDSRDELRRSGLEVVGTLDL
jgi:anti-anti-sigma regulatory factor